MEEEFSINDYADFMQLINIAVRRGTYDMDEMKRVMELYQKLENILNNYNQSFKGKES